ncbi:Tim17/Tim22/Tim23/Pmp24 family-domain-containing protein [Lactarius quietus]|nr:Tim17/Tim22/Tim23/Pmp24 family-domain-containing protein [Lactarius quietus]
MSSQSYPSSPPSSQDPSDLLKNVQFSSHNSDPLPETLTASDLLSGSYDPSKLHPMAGLGGQLDYLVLDDDKTSDLPGSGTAIPSRGWSDDLCYGTGTMYLGGMSSMLLAISATPSAILFASGLGGAWGFREGASRPLAVSNMRLRMNSVLNAITRRGTFLGNSAGVLALGYNGINSTIDALRGKHDAFGSMAAGALTGALFKSTAGVKPALAAATVVSAFAGGWSWVKTRV